MVDGVFVLGIWWIAFRLGLIPFLDHLGAWVRSFRTLLDVRDEETLRRLQLKILECEGMLQSGSLPDLDSWKEWKTFPDPWGSVSYETLESLRSDGHEVLPTLARLREVVTNQLSLVQQGRSRTAQALMQGVLGVALVPFLAWTLYGLLPELQSMAWAWVGATVLATLWCWLGVLQIHRLVQNARWLGLSRDRRSWIVGFRLLGESLLARIRSGRTPDEAWASVAQMAERWNPRILEVWKPNFWSPARVEQLPSSRNYATELFRRTSEMLRESLVVGLMEGRPMLARVQSQLDTFGQEVSSLLDRELQVLPQRALKPLFVFVAPALFAVLGAGLFFLSTGSLIES